MEAIIAYVGYIGSLKAPPPAQDDSVSIQQLKKTYLSAKAIGLQASGGFPKP